MSLTLEVSLVSGKTVSLQTLRAQRALGVGKGRLLSSSGSVLDGGAVLRLQQAEPLTLQVRRVDICAKKGAFADGSVVTWGDADCGGDSSGVRDQLNNVQQIQATCSAFAAILRDGSIVTWGNAGCGGDSSAVRGQLKNVQQIQANSSAFAAILGDGSVVTWGSTVSGGDSSSIRDQLKNVQQIQATDDSFAAILGDGSVVTWGSALSGGDSSCVWDQLKNVQQAMPTAVVTAVVCEIS